MTGNYTPSNITSDMSLTTPSDFAASFDGLDADFGAGFGSNNDFHWDETMTANFTAINTGTSSTQTISPKDLFNDYVGSAPPSTAFTNLTSPDMNESPYIASSTECSPLFSDSNDLAVDSSNWYPLFPESAGAEQVDPAPTMERQASNVSNEQSSPSSSSPLVLDQHNYNRRKPSNAATSPHNAMARHSSVSGVKPRRRKGPLPPIEVNPQDKVAVKRARNTLAARDSRQRKLDHLSNMEARIKELEEREDQLKQALIGYGYNGPLLQE